MKKLLTLLFAGLTTLANAQKKDFYELVLNFDAPPQKDSILYRSPTLDVKLSNDPGKKRFYYLPKKDYLDSPKSTSTFENIYGLNKEEATEIVNGINFLDKMPKATDSLIVSILSDERLWKTNVEQFWKAKKNFEAYKENIGTPEIFYKDLDYALEQLKREYIDNPDMLEKLEYFEKAEDRFN